MVSKLDFNNRTQFDLGWKFILGDEPGNPIEQCPVAYPINLNGVQCLGLSPADNQTSAAACQAAACAANMNLWQWCPPSGCSSETLPHNCWVGQLTPSMQCSPSAGWISSATNASFPAPPGPPPPPPVCPGDRACVAYDDSAWRNVNTPHDFVDEGVPNANADRNHGYLPFNSGCRSLSNLQSGKALQHAGSLRSFVLSQAF